MVFFVPHLLTGVGVGEEHWFGVFFYLRFLLFMRSNPSFAYCGSKSHGGQQNQMGKALEWNVRVMGSVASLLLIW